MDPMVYILFGLAFTVSVAFGVIIGRIFGRRGVGTIAILIVLATILGLVARQSTDGWREVMANATVMLLLLPAFMGAVLGGAIGLRLRAHFRNVE